MSSGTKPLFYWDSCVLIALIQDEKRPTGQMEAVFALAERFKKGDLMVMTSVLTRTELLEARLSPQTRGTYAALVQRPDFRECPVDHRIAEKARTLREECAKFDHALCTPDAIHLATALHYSAREFHTFDGCGKKKCNRILPLDGRPWLDGMKLTIPREPQLTLFTASGDPRYPTAPPPGK